jgi:hypothetical protein
MRAATGRNARPSAAIFDSRTLQSSPESGSRAGLPRGAVPARRLPAGVRVLPVDDRLGAGRAGRRGPNVLTIYNNRTHRYVGLAVWDPAAAAAGVDFFRDGHSGYLPAGVSYHSHSGVPFGGPGWSPQWQEYINYAWADSWDDYRYNDASGDSFTVARNTGSFVPDGTSQATTQQNPTGPPPPPNPIWCQPDVIAAMKQAWNQSGNGGMTLSVGQGGVEAGFNLNGTPSNYKIDRSYTNEIEKMTLKFNNLNSPMPILPTSMYTRRGMTATMARLRPHKITRQATSLETQAR